MADYTAFVEAGNGLVELLRENMTPEPISKRDLISLCSPHESENNQLTVYLFHIEEDKQAAPQAEEGPAPQAEAPAPQEDASAAQQPDPAPAAP